MKAEAEAIEALMIRVLQGKAEWVASRAVAVEIGRNSEEKAREDALALLQYTTRFAVPEKATFARTLELVHAGYADMDALHLALAEQENVDFLLTTDDRFLNRARRGEGSPRIRVINPVELTYEVSDGPH